MNLIPTTWPAEIVSLFIDEVAKDADNVRQEAVLSTCMLVSKAFYFPSRKYRFTNVKIPVRLLCPHDVKSMSAFLGALKANSSLLQYMQTFTLLFDGTDGVPDAKIFAAPKLEIISQVVELVSRATIHTLSIKCKEERSSVHLKRLGVEWEALLVALRHIPSIKILHLQCVHYPPRALVVGDPAKDTLEELHLSIVTLGADNVFHYPRRSGRTYPNFVRWRHVFEAASTTTLLPFSRLQVLRVDNVSYFHSFLRFSERKTPLPPPTLPCLRSFASSTSGVYWDFGEWDQAKLLDEVLPSLKSLSLTSGFPANPSRLPQDQLDFARFKNLRHLELAGWERDLNTCLPALCRFLSYITTPTTIESLSVTITHWLFPSSRFDVHWTYSLSEWLILDGILSNGHFSALTAFSLTFECRHRLGVGPTNLQEMFQDPGSEAHISSLLPLLFANQHISLHLNVVAERA